MTHLNWTPIFQWYVVRCESKNGDQKKNRTTCSKFVNHFMPKNTIIGGTLHGSLFDSGTSPTSKFQVDIHDKH